MEAEDEGIANNVLEFICETDSEDDDGVSVAVSKIFLRLQMIELREVIEHSKSDAVEDLQKLGHPTDASCHVVRCLLCPFMTFSTQGRNKYRWRRQLLRHLDDHENCVLQEAVSKKPA
eukprot:12404222-Karenia_brevis.AAC.2